MDTFYFKGQMYVLPSACSSLLHSIHSSPTTGHMGIFCTKAVLEHDFWWPGLSFFVKHFINGCALCQQNKVNTHLTIPLLMPISSSTTLPFKQLSVDLITNLPPSNTTNPSSWSQFLSTAEFHHNSTPYSSTKKSPFSLLYGYEPRPYPSLSKTFLPALKTQLTILDKA